jgi:predicted NBD/HSP70 family sugar kinase
MRIGVDLGGTKIEAIAIAPDGRELQRRRVAAPQGDYQRSVTAIVALVHELERDTALRGTVGVGIPGAISPATGLVKNANSTWLIGHPLAADLSRALDRPVRLANDANCFALSEAADGAAAGAPIVFGVILGTGTGGGVVVDGRIVEGRNRIAGEWGHNPLPAPNDDERPGPPCYCGRRGCIETFLSGPALRRDHHAATGEDLPAMEIAARAEGGDTGAGSSLSRYEDRLARALAGVINILDPHVIVVGGGLSNIARLYANVPARWTGHVFSDRVETTMVRAKHGDASGVRGAAWLWDRGDSGK